MLLSNIYITFHVKSMHKSKTSQTGEIGESIACIFLRSKGFSVIERNYRKAWGEIDIIATYRNIVHFVEVKSFSGNLDNISRENNSYRPEEQIHSAKLRKIVRTAVLYMESHKDEREYQIDAVGVILDPISRKARCTLYEQIL